MRNVMVALPNVGGALCSTPQSLAVLPVTHPTVSKQQHRMNSITDTNQEKSSTGFILASFTNILLSEAAVLD